MIHNLDVQTLLTANGYPLREGERVLPTLIPATDDEGKLSFKALSVDASGAVIVKHTIFIETESLAVD